MKQIPVLRPDGRIVKVIAKRGHLFVCALGCCCGHTEKGNPPVLTDLYHREWERRMFRNRFSLVKTDCLGTCQLANVVLLLFDGQAIWLHSLNSEEQILALYDYIEQMLEKNTCLPLPEGFSQNVFDGYDWPYQPPLLRANSKLDDFLTRIEQNLNSQSLLPG